MIRQSDPRSIVATGFLMLVVCLGPLPFGSVLVRERAFLQVAAFLALAAALAARRRAFLAGRCPLPAAAIAAAGLFGLLQSFPWPRFLAAALAPAVVESWDAAAALLVDPEGLVVVGGAVPLSLAPAVSREIGLHWLAVAAAFLAATLVAEERWLRRGIGFGFLAVALFELVYGLERWIGRSESMWGIEVAGDPTRLRGTFINPDHAAFFLMLAALGAAAWLWWSARRLAEVESFERRLLFVTVPALLFLLFFVGVAVTGSRAGLLALAAALVAQAALLGFHYRSWRVAGVGVGVLLFGLGSVAFLGLRQGLGRWLATSAYEVTWNSRLSVYGASWELFTSSPWTGTGLGTFRQAFPMVQPAELGKTWVHAHSDLLEILVTVGVLGPPLLALGAVVLARRLWTVFRTGRRSEDRAGALAVLGIVAGALCHSAVDFPLTIPANAFTLAILCGVACGTPTLGEES